MPSDETPSWFSRFAKSTSRLAGTPAAFMAAIGVVIVWSLTGPLFGYSDTWQLVINTGTTIITFLMVFLIQNTQNRDAEAVQIKLDELIRVTKGAHNALMNLEELGEEEFNLIREKYKELAEVYPSRIGEGERGYRHTYSVRKRCHIYSCFLAIGLAVADEVISSRRRCIGAASDSRFDILVHANKFIGSYLFLMMTSCS